MSARTSLVVETVVDAVPVDILDSRVEVEAFSLLSTTDGCQHLLKVSSWLHAIPLINEDWSTV